MDERQRTIRLVLLAAAGLLLVGGMLIWVKQLKNQEEPYLPPAPIQSKISPALPSPSREPAVVSKSTAPALPDKKTSAPESTSLLPKPALPGQLGLEKETGAGVVSEQKALSLPEAITSQRTAATERVAAGLAASASRGRPDPCAPLSELKAFPSKDSPATAFSPGQDLPGTKAKHAAKQEEGPIMVPPPPPAVVPESEAGLGALSLDELPAPPAKPSVAEKMKLIAVIGDRAILKFADNLARRENKWPPTISLGPGQSFHSVSVVGVGQDSVTLEEDGERTVKSLEPLR